MPVLARGSEVEMSKGALPAGGAGRRRAITTLAVGAVVVVAVLFVVAALAAVAVNGGTSSTVPSATNRPAPGPTPDRAVPDTAAAGWDVPGEDAIASRPMGVFPVEAAQPHTLSARSPGPAMPLPTATDRTGAVDRGFPRTPEGALAQLKALDETGMRGLDPDAYALAYQALALPAAPAVTATTLDQIATGTRSKGGLPGSGPVTGLTAAYQVDAGLIKGSTDRGNFVVPCVLGELSVVTISSVVRVGVGDCQAMRWVDGAWAISPTTLPVLAPATWPGSEEAVRAGYRAVSSGA